MVCPLHYISAEDLCMPGLTPNIGLVAWAQYLFTASLKHKVLPVGYVQAWLSYSVCVTYIRMWGHVMPACWIDRLQSFHSALQSSLYIYYSKSHQLCAEQLGMRNIQILHNYYSMMFVHHTMSYFNFMVDANYE